MCNHTANLAVDFFMLQGWRSRLLTLSMLIGRRVTAAPVLCCTGASQGHAWGGLYELVYYLRPLLASRVSIPQVSLMCGR